jgi:hypothetical protein
MIVQAPMLEKQSAIWRFIGMLTFDKGSLMTATPKTGRIDIEGLWRDSVVHMVLGKGGAWNTYFIPAKSFRAIYGVDADCPRPTKPEELTAPCRRF